MTAEPMTAEPMFDADPWVLNGNGAWCWYQDERALVDPDRGLLMVGSVAAPEGDDGEARAGNVELTVTELNTGRSEVVVLHENLEADDHNAPALWRRRDGRWLAVYAKHKTDNHTRWRISEPHDPTTWGPEQTFDWTELTGGRGVTYANLHEMDGRLYCFARAINDDACALVSDDEGDTWSFAGKLFDRPKVGYVNGYCRYDDSSRGSAGAGREGAGHGGAGRIDIITTDHHPRNFNNSIYHGYLAAGALHDSGGAVVDPHALSGDAPDQAELTTVFAADSVWHGEKMTRAWTTDIRRVGPAVAATFTTRANDEPENTRFDDHRFFYARSDGGGPWQVHQVANAGRALFPHEEDYTGLIAIDPYDVDSVYAATHIDPRDGGELAHHEIFHGRTLDAGGTWTWTPVTQDSGMDNLRPIVVPGDPGRVVLLWFRGTMTSSQHYDCEIAAHVRPRG